MTTETESHLPRLRQTHEDRTRLALAGYIEQIATSVDPDLPVFATERWNRQLTAILVDRGTDTAVEFGRILFALVGRSARFDPSRMDRWIETVASNSAARMNGAISDDLFDAQLAEDTPAQVEATLDRYLNVRTALWAVAVTTTFAMFGSHEGAFSAGAREKRWQVTSGNPRDSHRAVNGQVVAMGERFSNGLRWPGDPGPAGEIANCKCALVFLGG